MAAPAHPVIFGYHSLNPIAVYVVPYDVRLVLESLWNILAPTTLSMMFWWDRESLLRCFVIDVMRETELMSTFDKPEGSRWYCFSLMMCQFLK